MTYTDLHETIVAISSAAGHARRGIVRLSGPEAVDLAAGVFEAGGCSVAGGGDLRDAPGFSHHAGAVRLDAMLQAPATAYVFRAPRSYTRQDTVELHTIGAPPLLDMLVELFVAAGARLAEPGEFTARAYLGGGLNLTEAEAVAATIGARSDAQLRAARRMMRGELVERVRDWRETLVDLLALVVADIDFAEEPIDFIAPAELVARLDALRSGIVALTDTAERSERLDVLPYVLLLGLPNAGKSTLFNTLTGIDRALASEISGTTRDVLAEPVQLGDTEVMMLDAAGIDDNPDEVIAHGRQRALDAAGRVDLVCLVVDAAGSQLTETARQLAGRVDAPIVVAANKVDLLAESDRAERLAALADAGVGPVVEVSGATGWGVDELRGALYERLTTHPQAASDASLTLTARQRTALSEAAAALARCRDLARETQSTLDVAELLAVELREATDALDAIAGGVSTEDLLGRIFASFCIGK